MHESSTKNVSRDQLLAEYLNQTGELSFLVYENEAMRRQCHPYGQYSLEHVVNHFCEHVYTQSDDLPASTPMATAIPIPIPTLTPKPVLTPMLTPILAPMLTPMLTPAPVLTSVPITVLSEQVQTPVVPLYLSPSSSIHVKDPLDDDNNNILSHTLDAMAAASVAEQKEDEDEHDTADHVPKSVVEAARRLTRLLTNRNGMMETSWLEDIYLRRAKHVIDAQGAALTMFDVIQMYPQQFQHSFVDGVPHIIMNL